MAAALSLFVPAAASGASFEKAKTDKTRDDVENVPKISRKKSDLIEENRSLSGHESDK